MYNKYVMSFEFSEKDFQTEGRLHRKKLSKMVLLLIHIGLAKNEQQANSILLALVAVLCVIMVMSFSFQDNSRGRNIDESINPTTNLPHGVVHPE